MTYHKFLVVCVLAFAVLFEMADSTAVTATDCTANTDCKAENSECDTGGGKCKCSDGYVEGTSDNCGCFKVPVTDVGCTDNDNTLCTAANSECDGAGTPKCKCSDGYVIGTTDETKSSCFEVPVTCVECTDNNNALCTAANSECDGETSPKCKCSDGYVIGTTDETKSSCFKVPVTDVACTDNNNALCTATNSECDGETSPKCKCSDGYVIGTTDETKSSCFKVAVTSMACTGNAESLCTAENSECDDQSTPKCKCSAKYKQGTSDETQSTCVSVLGSECNSNCDCDSDLANSYCKSGVCACSTDYAAENNICLRAVGTACGAVAECVSNTECSTTCKCLSGYKEANGLCASSADTERSVSIYLMLSAMFTVVGSLV